MWLKKLGIHFIFRILLNLYLAYKFKTQYTQDFVHYVLKISEELASQHSAGAKVIIENYKDEQLQRPRKKMRRSALKHNHVMF